MIVRIQNHLLSYSLVKGGWGQWTDDTTCTKTCGSGTLTRSRSCDDPSPVHGGKKCLLSDKSGRALTDTLTISCVAKGCPGE